VTEVIVTFWLVLWPAGAPNYAHAEVEIGSHRLPAQDGDAYMGHREACERALELALKNDPKLGGTCVRRARITDGAAAEEGE
jgi:hypothetical protein